MKSVFCLNDGNKQVILADHGMVGRFRNGEKITSMKVMQDGKVRMMIHSKSEPMIDMGDVRGESAFIDDKYKLAKES